MIFCDGQCQAIIIENGICPLCGGHVDLENPSCENCGEYECDVFTVGSNVEPDSLIRAARGDAEEQRDAGYRWEQWNMFPFHQEVAHYWYKRAANGGDACAQFNLATQYFLGHGVEKSEEEALYWYRESAMQGWSKAQANLGAIYLNGDFGLEPDAEEGTYWLEKAARQGHKQAQYNLACCYFDGVGVRQDYDRGIELLKASARQGFAPAMDLLSEI